VVGSAQSSERRRSERAAGARAQYSSRKAGSKGTGFGISGGRYWVRTSDLFGVNEARYHCANRPDLLASYWVAGETIAH
jgi:hypothetical protein